MKRLLILVCALGMFSFAFAGFAEEKVPEEIKDIPGLTNEFVKSYNLFMQAQGEGVSPTYEDAIKSFDGALKTAKTDDLKLRIHYFLTFCHYLNNDVSTAYKHALETIKLAGKVYKNNPDVGKLNNIIEKINKGEIKTSEQLEKEIGEGEISEFFEELITIQEREQQLGEIKKKCSEKKK